MWRYTMRYKKLLFADFICVFGFILIEMPIVAFLSVVNDVHQPLPILIMALICTVIDVFIITNRITFHKANGGNEERMRKIRKAVKILR